MSLCCEVISLILIFAVFGTRVGASFGIFKVHQHRHTYHPAEFLTNRTNHPRQSDDVISIIKMASRHRNSTSDFGFRNFAQQGRSKYTCIPIFGEISQSVAEIILLPFSRKQTYAILEFYFRFRLLRLLHHRYVFLHLLTKHRPNWTMRAGVMTSYTFFKMAAASSQFYPRFGFDDFAHLRRQKSTCKPNFDEMFQSRAEILLLPISENKRPPCWNFTFASTSACHSASAYQISSKSDHP